MLRPISWLRAATGSPPALAALRFIRACSRASSKETRRVLPSPRSQRFPWILRRCSQRFAPLGSTTRYSPLPSLYLPGVVCFLTARDASLFDSVVMINLRNSAPSLRYLIRRKFVLNGPVLLCNASIRCYLNYCTIKHSLFDFTPNWLTIFVRVSAFISENYKSH